ncbi:MAG: hypothetical protein DRN15_08085 [Thermoprotei archaeon]|nr:MAG: hypothetical protein DRN15_08085 [Thermoprotei archaeon]
MISSRDVALIAICGALYCAGSLITAYIPTGVIIQLRPAVVIPAVFAVLFGPLIGGVGAAIGTFIASIIRYGTPILTIVSGTPANLACFYLMGYLTWKLSEKAGRYATSSRMPLLRRRERWILSYLVGNVVGYAVGFTIIAIGLYALALITMGGETIGMPWLSKWLNFQVMLIGIFMVGFLPEFIVSYFLGVPLIEVLSRAFPDIPFNKVLLSGKGESK